MFKSKTKYTWEGWDSSGRESWVFNVKHPCELMGVHAKLIDKELEKSEKIEYCIYAPRVSSTSTPFGLKSEESSCGICVTDNRFIISKNRHIKEHKPRLDSINFKDILYLNFGGVMLLSWFSITYICEGLLKQLPIIFSSNGRHHFEKAIRSYKKYLPVINADNFGLDSFTAASFIYKIADNFHKNYLKSLISVDERCVLTFFCSYVLSKFKRKKNIFRRTKEILYVSDKATFLLTNKALMVVRNNRQSAIEAATDVLCIPLGKIKTVSLSEKLLNKENIYVLEINFINGETDLLFELIPYYNESISGLKTIETFLKKMRN